MILCCERFILRLRSCLFLEEERKMRSFCIFFDLNFFFYYDGDDDGYCSDYIGLFDVVDVYIIFSNLVI